MDCLVLPGLLQNNTDSYSQESTTWALCDNFIYLEYNGLPAQCRWEREVREAQGPEEPERVTVATPATLVLCKPLAC